MPIRKPLAHVLALLGSVVLTASLGSQNVAPSPREGARLSIQHTVAISDQTAQLFHITSRFVGIVEPVLTLALPVWSPGWYTIENYAKNILRMRVMDGNGRPLPHRMTRKQTWKIDTAGAHEVRVEFDYRANLLALNQAKITSTFAFFTGTQLFLEAVGHRAAPETVQIVAPQGWRILSALRETAAPDVFVADNYDQLVDAPTLMGQFDLTAYDVDGTPHYLAVTPAGRYPPSDYAKVTPLLAKIIRTEAAIFGGQPYEKYIAFYFSMPAETRASGALEHLNSYVTFIAPGRPLESILPLFAHEAFHAWNVKRLRPAQMWPYDYARENETPLLWVSEGFSDYYGLLARLRAGVSAGNACCASDSMFLGVTASRIAGVEANDARHYQSLADASTSAWLGYDTPQAFSVDYYGGGHVIATLLDVMLRRDTRGERGLDDVMRRLWEISYRAGRGFTTEDVVAALHTVSGRDYGDFIRRYVEGTEVPPYDSIFAAVGYRLEFDGRSASDGPRATTTSPVVEMTAKFVDVPSPTAEQMAIRKAWLSSR